MRDHQTLLGRPLALRLRTPALAAWFENAWVFPEARPLSSDYAIGLEERTDPAPSTGGGRSVFATAAAGVRILLSRRDDDWWWSEGAAGARLDLRQTSAHVTVWGIDGEVPVNAGVAVQVFLCEAMRASGLVPLHAAVAALDGEATAFAAPSGTGKSTTLVEAMRAGWSPVCEDFGWLDPTDGVVHGWDRALRLRADSAARLPGGAALAVGTDPHGKLVIPFDRLGAARQPFARLTAIAELVRTPGERSLREPLGGREAVRVLWEAAGAPLSEAARDVTSQWIVTAVRTLEVSRLRLGAGPIELGARAPASTISRNC